MPTVQISIDGVVYDSTLVQAHDTVKWLANGVEKATITFTGSEPFTESLGGTLTLTGDSESSTYTVSTAARAGKYPYTVVVNGGAHTFSCDVQVVSSDAGIATATGP
jgi:plastocyanin